jgi:hypothetical protein
LPRPPLAGLIATAARPQAMLTLLEDELLRRVRETAGLGLVRHASGVIAAAAGAVAIGDLHAAAGVSSTHLAQRFKEVVGVTPKRRAPRSTPPGRSTGSSSPAAPATTTRPTSATTSGRSRA